MVVKYKILDVNVKEDTKKYLSSMGIYAGEYLWIIQQDEFKSVVIAMGSRYSIASDLMSQIDLEECT